MTENKNTFLNFFQLLLPELFLCVQFCCFFTLQYHRDNFRLSLGVKNTIFWYFIFRWIIRQRGGVEVTTFFRINFYLMSSNNIYNLNPRQDLWQFPSFLNQIFFQNFYFLGIAEKRPWWEAVLASAFSRYQSGPIQCWRLAPGKQRRWGHESCRIPTSRVITVSFLLFLAMRWHRAHYSRD